MTHQKFLSACFMIALGLFFVVGCSRNQSDLLTIYARDDRATLATAEPNLAAFAGSVALLTHSFRMKTVGESFFKIPAPKLGDFFGLCQEEPFFEERVVGDCTGFLVSETQLVTAGHCISSHAECEQRKFVFNHHTAGQELFATQDVYSCRRIISSLPKSKGDLVVVELDRPKTNPSGSRLFNVASVASTQHTELVTLGYPSGISLKSAPLEGRRHSRDTYSFRGRADVSGGSSGSPLFSPETGTLEGVVLGGENDFVWDASASCSRSKVCTADTCSGERFASREALLNLFKM
ncbi:MAG: trypsin-like peptidase domain-containing protein [Betaproteobacteria bacterium]|nr:trypsin-like peptidase domain-containing protein [Betaproteobacteria bacterium]